MCRGIKCLDLKIMSVAVVKFCALLERTKNYSSVVKHYKSLLLELKELVENASIKKIKQVQNDLFQTISLILGHKTIADNVRIPIMERLIAEQKIELKENVDDTFQALANLLHGFHCQVHDKLKAALSLIAIEGIKAIKCFSNNKAIRSSVIDLFYKLIITIGPELIQALKELMELLISNTKDTQPLNEVIVLLTSAVSSWKSKGAVLAKEAFEFVFNAVKGLGIPKVKISDWEKSILDIVFSFIKLLKTIAIDDVLTFFELPLDKFKELIRYVAEWTCCKLDETIRRFALSYFVTLLGSLLQLKSICEGGFRMIAEYSKKEATSLITKEEHLVYMRELMEVLKVVGVRPLEVIDPFKAVDSQSLNEVITVQFFVYKIVGLEFVTLLHGWISTISIESLQKVLEKLGEANNIQTYKEKLKKIIRKEHRNKLVPN